MNRKLLLLIAAFLSFSLFYSSGAFAINDYSRRVEGHSENWDGFRTDGYVSFEREKRNEREKAKKQARLNYLRDVLNLAGKYYVKDETVPKEAEEAAKVDGAPTASTENEVAFETVRQSIIARTTLLENEIKTRDSAYLNALRGWEDQYRINRANALHNDVAYIYIHFNFNVSRPSYNPLSSKRRTEEFDVSENFAGIDSRWRLEPPSNISFHRYKGYKDPGWNSVREESRFFFAHFWQTSPRADDSTSGHGSSNIDIRLTLRYTNQAITNRVNEEIRLCKQAVK